MKDRHLLFGVIALVLAATANAQLAGQYMSKDFLSGHATFRIEVRQTGPDVSISFRGDYKNPDSAGPRGTGIGRGDDRAAHFEFKDSCGNSGDGVIIRRLDNRVVLSMKARDIADFSCLIFYQNNLQLKPLEKK